MKTINPVVVAVITDSEGRILLQKRHDPGSKAHDFWEFPGGGMEWGETPEQALTREVKEETGFEIEILRLLPKIYTNNWGDYQVLLLAYHCKVISGEYIKQDLEVADGKFFKKEEIDLSTCLPYTKEIIDLLEK